MTHGNESGGISPAVAGLPDTKLEHPLLGHLKQLGTVLTVGTLVGLFSKLLGATDPKAAALTLALVAAIYIVLYRDSIQRLVKSSSLLLSIVLVALALVLFRDQLTDIWIDRTLKKATGIVEYSPRANDFLPRLGNLIDKAEEEVWFTGISFYITLPANREALFKALDRGVNVRFLIYDPRSPNIAEVAAGFSQSPQELASECHVTIENLRTLAAEAKAKKTKGHLEVKLFSSIPKMRLYIFDRRKERGLTYFIPHVDQQNSPNVPGFLATNVRTGIAPAFIDGAERLWARAQSSDVHLEGLSASPIAP